MLRKGEEFITEGKMADVVLNSLGMDTWESTILSVGINGRWIAFGGLTGADVKLNVHYEVYLQRKETTGFF